MLNASTEPKTQAAITIIAAATKKTTDDDGEMKLINLQTRCQLI